MLRRLVAVAVIILLLAGMRWIDRRPTVPEPPPLPTNLAPATGDELADYFERHEATLRPRMPDYDEKRKLYREIGHRTLSAWHRDLLGVDDNGR